MSTRNRIDAHRVHDLRTALYTVLHNTTNFLKCPLDDLEMLKVWHADFPTEILDAMILLESHRYFNHETHTEDTVTFLIKDFHSGAGSQNRPLAMRWHLMGAVSHRQRFTDPPRDGKFMVQVPMIKSGNNMFRSVLYSDIQKVLGPERNNELFEWAVAAATATERHKEARKVVSEITEMISTTGQLRRMVPDLVNYLPLHLQQAIGEQKRASPFPDQWATYDKAAVERMTAALAEGHLLGGMAKQRATGNNFSWAEFAPQGWQGVPYVSL